MRLSLISARFPVGTNPLTLCALESACFLLKAIFVIERIEPKCPISLPPMQQFLYPLAEVD